MVEPPVKVAASEWEVFSSKEKFLALEGLAVLSMAVTNLFRTLLGMLGRKRFHSGQVDPVVSPFELSCCGVQ